MAQNLDRYDLAEQDILDLEDIKSDLGSDAERSSLSSSGHFDSNPNSRPCNAPSTPLKVNPKLKFSLVDSENRNILSSLSEFQSENMPELDSVKPLRGSVTSYKGWITRTLKSIKKAKDDKTIL